MTLLLISVGVAVASTAVPPQRIFVDRFVPNQIDLYVANADGTGERRLLQQPSELDYNAAYSLDGQSIVFTSERNGSADLYQVKSDGTALERLTDHPAYDDQAAFSPDGRDIVFVSSREGGHANLWILNKATRRARRLTHQASGDFRPAWSPDGKWIAFSSDRETPIQKAAGRWEYLHLIDVYVIRPDGSGLRRLTTPGGACGSAKWSRDGRQLVAYCMSGMDSWLNRSAQASGTSRLVSIDVATGATTDIAAGPGAKMSPAFVAGREVGYVRKDGSAPGIFYVGGQKGPGGVLRSASWAPDGSRVIYHRLNGAVRTIGKPLWSGVPGYEIRTVSEVPAFNRTGRLLLASRNVRGDWLLNIVDSGTWNERLLYQADGASVMGGQFSPQDDEVAFGIGGFLNNRERGAQISIVKTDGSGFRLVTRGPNNNAFPSYSPDGKQLVYRTTGPDGRGLRVMNLTDHSVRTLTNEADNFPVWSPRDDVILFTRLVEPAFQIFTIHADGTGLRQLTSAAGNHGHGVWSPDGTAILFDSARMGFKDEVIYLDGQQPQGELFVMRADGTNVRQLTDNQWEDGTPAWQPEPPNQSSR